MKSSLIAVACTALLGACASTPTPSQPAANTPPPAAAKSTTVATPATKPVKPMLAYQDPSSVLYQQRSVYFDFDQYSIKPEFQSMLLAHGKFLASSPATTVKIEGNADERGSREYNLALGQKRAEAVRKALTLQGVPEKQLEAISWGSEKPKAEGHDETAWSKNRRADIVYPQ